MLEQGQRMTPANWVTAVLSDVAVNRPARFAGLGLILYRPPLDLPVTPLAPSGMVRSQPEGRPEAAAELLRELSDSSNPLHDGFHLVDANSLTITHLCHFFAPPIPADIARLLPPHPVGARFMAALLGSLLPSVVMTALLSDSDGPLMIERGLICRLEFGRS